MMFLLSWKGISAFECFHSRVHSPVQSVFEEDTLFFALVVVVDIPFEIPSTDTDCTACTVPSLEARSRTKGVKFTYITYHENVAFQSNLCIYNHNAMCEFNY